MLGKEEGLQFASLLQPVKASTHKLERRVVLKKCSTKFAGKILICSRRYPVPNILYTVYIYTFCLRLNSVMRWFTMVSHLIIM